MEQIRVEHAIHPNFGEDDKPEPRYPQDYRIVALVDVPEGTEPCAYIGMVHILTNHIDWEWWKNEGVTLIGEPKQRSTSIGDVVMLPDGRKFKCVRVGWEKIN